MKRGLKAIMHFFAENFFVLLAFLAFLLPDLQLRGLVEEGVFTENYVLPVTLGFSALWAVLFLLVCVAILPEKPGRLAYIVLNSLFIVLSFCQYVYFKIFGQFFWLKSIALAGEGAGYLDFALKYIDLRVLLCTGLALLFVASAAIMWRKPKATGRGRWALLLVPVLGLTALHIFMLPETFNESQNDWDSWRRPRVVYKQKNDANKSLVSNGLYQMTIRDLYSTCFAHNKYGEADFARVEEYFEKQGAPVPNEYTGIFKDKNVIAVMLEGIDTWMTDKKYTPTMQYMMDNGLDFTNYYSPTFGTGHTFNAEFAFNTGYFSPPSAVSATNFSTNRFPYSMANLFRAEGYSANSFHYNSSEFYNRGIMHKNFGYEEYNSFPDFDMPITVSQSDSNILKNDAIYQKMIEKQPFFNFIITYSGHVPYTFDDAKLALAKENHPDLIDTSMDLEKNNCLILAADTDDFFRQLLTKLEADKLLDDTVIIVYTDHYAYGFSDQEKLKSYKNGKKLYQVPAFIYAKGLKGEKISKPSQTIDMLPTILNLFGIKTEMRFIGKDILSPEAPGFVYFEDGAWLDEKMYYVPSNEEPAPEDKEYIAAQNERARESLEITEIVITGDYFAGK